MTILVPGYLLPLIKIRGKIKKYFMLQTSAFISTINQATIYQNSKCVLILHLFFSLELVNQPVSEGDVAKHPQGEGPGYHNSKDEICVRLHFSAILSYI